MAKADVSLPVEMERLEIEPSKINKAIVDENPFNFTQYKVYTKSSPPSLKCLCSKNGKALAISKKKHKKILKEPVLKFLQNCNRTTVRGDGQKLGTKYSLSAQDSSTDILNLCSLVDNCNQLRISSDCNDDTSQDSNCSTSEVKWWANDVSPNHVKKETCDWNQAGSSCSQQALNPSCDVTIDELASYFETLVHIPKKMSSMAEMMYI